LGLQVMPELLMSKLMNIQTKVQPQVSLLLTDLLTVVVLSLGTRRTLPMVTDAGLTFGNSVVILGRVGITVGVPLDCPLE